MPKSNLNSHRLREKAKEEQTKQTKTPKNLKSSPKVTQKITCRNRILGNDAFKTHPKTGPRTCQTHPKTDPRNNPEMQLRKIPESGLGKKN